MNSIARRPWLRVKEYADLMDLTPRTVYELLKTGKIPHVRVGRSIRIAASQAHQENGRTGEDVAERQ